MTAAMRGLTRQPLCVPHDIDDAGVTTAGEDHEAATVEAHHDRLVVEDQRVRLPAAVDVRLVTREAGLERRRAIDLTGHEHRAVEQERRLSFLDDLEAHALERGATGHG